MKQLLFNFLFFVAAAFVFIQCARFFPSNEKTLQHQLLQNKTSAITIANGNKFATNILKNRNNLKSAALVPFIHNGSVPYRMMMKINGHRIFYNPYTLFKDYNLAVNNHEDWQ